MVERRLLTVLLGCVAYAGASATVVNFDDLPMMDPTHAEFSKPLPNDYQGFAWDNWGYTDNVVWLAEFGNRYNPPSLYNFAFNYYGLTSVQVSNSSAFDFVGASVSTWPDHEQFVEFSSMSLTIEGYRNGALVGSVTKNLSSHAFEWFDANLNGVDTLVFKNDGEQTHWWVLDDFTYKATSGVPAPAAVIPFVVGLVLLRRRR